MRSGNVTSHLANVPLFAGCSKKELAAIARLTDQLTLEDGRVLTKQDAISHEAFIILSGKVVVKRNDRQVAVLGAGDTLGELGLLDNGPRTATAVAMGPVDVLVIGRREFAGLLQDVPAIAHKVLKTLAATIRELDRKAFG